MALWVMQGAADALQPVLAVDVTAHKPLLNQTLTWLMNRNRNWCVHTSAAASRNHSSASICQKGDQRAVRVKTYDGQNKMQSRLACGVSEPERRAYTGTIRYVTFECSPPHPLSARVTRARRREGEEPFANGEDVDEGTLWAATVAVTERMRRVSPYDTTISSRQLTVVAKAAVESKPATSLPDVNELRADTPTFVYVVWLTADGWNRPWAGRAAQTVVEYVATSSPSVRMPWYCSAQRVQAWSHSATPNGACCGSGSPGAEATPIRPEETRCGRRARRRRRRRSSGSTRSAWARARRCPVRWKVSGREAWS